MKMVIKTKKQVSRNTKKSLKRMRNMKGGSNSSFVKKIPLVPSRLPENIKPIELKKEPIYATYVHSTNPGPRLTPNQQIKLSQRITKNLELEKQAEAKAAEAEAEAEAGRIANEETPFQILKREFIKKKLNKADRNHIKNKFRNLKTRLGIINKFFRLTKKKPVKPTVTMKDIQARTVMTENNLREYFRQK